MNARTQLFPLTTTQTWLSAFFRSDLALVMFSIFGMIAAIGLLGIIPGPGQEFFLSLLVISVAFAAIFALVASVGITSLSLGLWAGEAFLSVAARCVRRR